jgi:RecQ family ATP-dependent DNA helicase
VVAVAVTPAVPLAELLSKRFGHPAFRPGQEDVVRAVVEGKDALLVMPTGAGKSLCYQLPALARGACGLVVSPLIALMEDQVGKLRAQGMRAERIHSGRPREESREVCRAYLKGELDFLFFAPERLAVPGFPELLKKRTPALIAVDEAHCISQWGHDFRPEYRMLGERLLGLRECPVLALTATATPQVQEDILTQLKLHEPEKFVRGFRRTNIALEIVEAKVGERRAIVAELLADEAMRPAIVYAPSRKEADELASEFAAEGLAIAAYHAGLPPPKREAVQRAFLEGAIDVVAATIAFGMGVDKANVRSVIHLALPGSIEAYSQEVGRAGRDGAMSRAVLLCGYADRRTHEFFLERDYPEVSRLTRVYAALEDTPLDSETVRASVRMAPDAFAPALDKLWVHGGALIDMDQRVRRGSEAWRGPYEAQRAHKEDQLERMARYAESGRCRVLGLLDHFGADDGKGPCGICDACAPQDALLKRARPTTLDENRHLDAILERLARAPRDGLGTGKLFTESVEKDGVSRPGFEAMLRALERASAIRLTQDSFSKNGQTVRYTRAHLLKRSTAGATIVPPAARGKARGTVRKKRGVETPVTSASPEHIDRLKRWRLERARAERVPAFRVLQDEVLTRIAAARPRTLDELGAVRGMGERLLKRYGQELLAIFDDTLG